MKLPVPLSRKACGSAVASREVEQQVKAFPAEQEADEAVDDQFERAWRGDRR